jgi:hypothetical protein
MTHRDFKPVSIACVTYCLNAEPLTMTMFWSNLRDGHLITRQLNFEIALPQSTVTKPPFSDKALLRRLVLEMHEQKMSYREIGNALGLHWTRVHQIVKRQWASL